MKNDFLHRADTKKSSKNDFLHRVGIKKTRGYINSLGLWCHFRGDFTLLRELWASKNDSCYTYYINLALNPSILSLFKQNSKNVHS